MTKTAAQRQRGQQPSVKASITKWRRGADGFLAWLEDVEPRVPSAKGGYEIYVPGPRERKEIRAALDGDYSTVVFCWPRRHGKTLAAALIIVWRFTTLRTQTVAIVANSERQSVDTAFRLVRTILEQTPYTKALIAKGAIKIAADRIEYADVNNRIEGYPANAAVLYGKKISIAQISELHAARNDAVFQALASSTIDSDDGIVLIDSTVGARNSPLYALHQVHERGDDPTLFFSHISYRDLEDACSNSPPWIKPARIRSRAAQMLPAEFAQQHLNQWTAGTSALFPADVLDRCRESYAVDVDAITGGAAYSVGGGLDRAYGFSLNGDATVTACILKTLQGEDEHYYVMAADVVRFSSARGIKANLTKYQRTHGMRRAAIESYNAQDIAAWCADQDFDHELISPTAERQANCFTALYNAASEGRLHIHPTFEKLLSEMEQFEYRLEATGTSKGTIPKFEAAKGSHDDHVYALAWSIYALREIELNPYEIQGIHCDAAGPVAPLCLLNGGSIKPPCHDACRSFGAVEALYGRYRDRAGIAPVALGDFIETKLTNVGAHSMRR